MKKERHIPPYALFRRILQDATGLARLAEEVKWSNIHAKHLERDIRAELERVMDKNDIEDRDVIAAYERLVDLALKDNWLRPKLNTIAILRRNFGRLITS